MEGGASKTNTPNCHPSNTVHKAATASSKQAETKPTQEKPTASLSHKTPQHEINKTAVIVGMIGVAALLFMLAHRQDQEPGELGKIAYHLPCGFEKEAHNRANQPGKHRTNFRSYILKTVSRSSAVSRSSVVAPTTAPIEIPAARKGAVTVTPYF